MATKVTHDGEPTVASEADEGCEKGRKSVDDREGFGGNEDERFSFVCVKMCVARALGLAKRWSHSVQTYLRIETSLASRRRFAGCCDLDDASSPPPLGKPVESYWRVLPFDTELRVLIAGAEKSKVAEEGTTTEFE
jgi:hypothetical protein